MKVKNESAARKDNSRLTSCALLKENKDVILIGSSLNPLSFFLLPDSPSVDNKTKRITSSSYKSNKVSNSPKINS